MSCKVVLQWVTKYRNSDGVTRDEGTSRSHLLNHLLSREAVDKALGVLLPVGARNMTND